MSGSPGGVRPLGSVNGHVPFDCDTAFALWDVGVAPWVAGLIGGVGSELPRQPARMNGAAKTPRRRKLITGSTLMASASFPARGALRQMRRAAGRASRNA